MDQVVYLRRVNSPPRKSSRPPTGRELLAEREKLPEYRITVPDRISSPHKLVTQTRRALRRATPDEQGRVQPSVGGCLSLRVTPGLVNRSLGILDALLKAFEVRGFAVEPACPPDSFSTVEILGVHVPFVLEEKISWHHREKRPLNEPPYEYLPPYDYIPTGRLVLRPGEPKYGVGYQQAWRDTDKRRLEDILNRFVIGLIEKSGNMQDTRFAREGWQCSIPEEQREGWERLVQEEQHRREEERIRTKQLTANAAAWREARDMRDFIEAVRAEAVRRQGVVEKDSDIGRWLEWAEQRVAETDPLHESKSLPTCATEVAGHRWP